jgi:hypothetical protein
MTQVYDNLAARLVVNIDGSQLLIDTSAACTFYDEFQGVRVEDLSRILCLPLDGVLGMDGLKGKVLSLGKNRVDINGKAPDQAGTPLSYVAGIPCVDIKINQIPCLAAIRTCATTTYISEQLISRDRPTRLADDFHPVYGRFNVKKYVNYFSVANKNFFADAGELPSEPALVFAEGVDAIVGADMLDRFDMIIDFSSDHFYLLSN